MKKYVLSSKYKLHDTRMKELIPKFEFTFEMFNNALTRLNVKRANK